MTETKFEMMRVLADALYDHQEVRIRSMNRVRAYLRRILLGLGYAPESKKNEESEKEQEWKDEEIEKLLNNALNDNKLSEEEYNNIIESWRLASRESKIEQEFEKKFEPLIKSEPIWTGWLEYVRGISNRNTARLLKHFGYCEDFPNVSKLWAYAGLSVKDGKSIKRTKGEKLPYSFKIKTDCIGVIGTSLVRSGGGYKRIYDTYKARIQERGCCDNEECRKKPGHAHNMATRYMVKMFLSHYWQQSRELMGLSTRSPYAHEYMGHQTITEPVYDKQIKEVIA